MKFVELLKSQTILLRTEKKSYAQFNLSNLKEKIVMERIVLFMLWHNKNMQNKVYKKNLRYKFNADL